jgi:hypothetical protein
MIKKKKFGFAVVSLFVLLIIILMNVYAFWDKTTSDNITGNSKHDYQAFSDVDYSFWKLACPLTFIEDSVAIIKGRPATFTKLKFDWKINSGHRLKGTVPYNGKYRASGKWNTFKRAIHKDFTLELWPTCVPPVPASMGTATAHTPWSAIDIFIKIIPFLAAGEKVEVGGELAFLASNEKIQIPEVDMARDEPDAEEYSSLSKEDSRNTPLSDDDEMILRVYSTLEESGEGKYAFKYWAVNYTEYSISGEWATYKETIEESWEVFEFTVEPNTELLLDEFESKGEPLELCGSVKIELDGEEFIFFAPAFSAEEEEEETRVHNPERLKKGKLERK